MITGIYKTRNNSIVKVIDNNGIIRGDTGYPIKIKYDEMGMALMIEGNKVIEEYHPLDLVERIREGGGEFELVDKRFKELEEIWNIKLGMK